MAEIGENEYWVRQHGGVVVEDCLDATKSALCDLGKWFHEKTGKMLVCTAGTNGQHAISAHCHANGWKIDVNDWAGPEGLDCTLFGYFNSPAEATQLFWDFIAYGHSLGLGMAIEGDHLDIQISGYEWTTGEDFGGYKSPNGNVTAPKGAAAGGNPAKNQQSMFGRVSPRQKSFKDNGSSVELLPSKKTYAEPVYPDYVYVTGNIPNTAVSDTAVNNMQKLQPTDGHFSIMTGQAMENLTGVKMGGFTTDKMWSIAQREFDPTKSISEVKIPSAGKPLNNNDPFPVDKKIEELEQHLPRVKKYKLPYDPEVLVTRDLAKAIIDISDNAEKRITKLENLMATVMRYTFAMGSRMHVNCVYWGGTCHRGKYIAIRCLKDDRMHDGQVMQIDQCLSCSRYEPFIGQTYDIINEVGANLSSILDDCQAGYMNMQEYIDFCRVEKMHQPKEEYKLNYKETHKRDPNELGFKEQWDDGVKMNWNLTPVEQQKPQINWRQDINSADKSPGKLASYQQNNGLGGSGLNPTSTIAAGNMKDWMGKHLQYMQDILDGKVSFASNEDGNGSGSSTKNMKLMAKAPSTAGDGTQQQEDVTGLIKEAIKKGFAAASDGIINQAVENMSSCGYEQQLQETCKNANVDPALAFAFVALASQGMPADTSSGEEGGLFGVRGSDVSSVKAQIEAGVNYLKEIIAKYAPHGNPLGAIQACKDWKESLGALNTGNQMYNDKWFIALRAAGCDTSFAPMVVKTYERVAAAQTNLSQATSGRVDGPEFPVKTEELQYVTPIQDYGVVNADIQGAAASIVASAMFFKVSQPVSIYTPFTGAITEAGEDKYIGKYIAITDSATKDMIAIGGLTEVHGAKGEGAEKNSCIGKADVFFALQYTAGNDGRIKDPKAVWALLENARENKTLGDLIKERAIQ